MYHFSGLITSGKVHCFRKNWHANPIHLWFLSYLGWLIWKLLFWNQCAHFHISGWIPYLLSFMSTYEFWCIGTLVKLYWIPYLGRAVEQLATALHSRSKYNSHAMSYDLIRWCNRRWSSRIDASAWDKSRPYLHPPDRGCGVWKRMMTSFYRHHALLCCFTALHARWRHADVCRLPCSASCSGNNIGRCISAVHIRQRCSAGIRQQCFVAEWLGLSVTVRVRVRARAREWNPFLLFFFLLCKCGGHHLLCSPGAWPALSMSHVSMTSSGMKRGEQSGSRCRNLRKS